ncbi:hypothetical protein PM10SUCC1_07640 [Propionigenium maris DSM 9537]|uniref:Zinc resistance-associated protein n=1 Tax=Propionigenium maris DSM 9537 TaxID=1123000 RepID=A0A9W6LLZ6_9FUSO|nr:periplasmic heavy metal sensor [Propionigenium maris]GLI55249.1 hypothetical protein PM10SUCC1_07640 [Propionigenium maris DSM 9537]
MKKIIAVLAVVVSTGAFAQGYSNYHGNNSSRMNHNHRGSMITQQVENLTPEQQKEFSELHSKHRDRMRAAMLDIKDVNLKIQREMLAETPNQKNINKLIDEKSKLQAKKQKDALNYRMEMKEKFGLEMNGHMGGKGCMSNKGRSKGSNRMMG